MARRAGPHYKVDTDLPARAFYKEYPLDSYFDHYLTSYSYVSVSKLRRPMNKNLGSKTVKAQVLLRSI